MRDHAFFKITYGLYSISSKYYDNYSACIANTFIQVTDQPKQICFVLNKNNYTTELINRSKIANIGVLPENISMDIIKKLGTVSGRNHDKFNDISYFLDRSGIKQVKDVVAYFCVEVNKIIDLGTHYMFICSVEDADLINDLPVLTYEQYHQRKAKKGYRCKVCGFIYEGEVLPKDYICPICKVDVSYFEKV